MSLSDYSHHNEDAHYYWWMEEGRHIGEAPEPADEPDWDGDLPTVSALRRETGHDAGCCPACGSGAWADGACDDCGVELEDDE